MPEAGRNEKHEERIKKYEMALALRKTGKLVKEIAVEVGVPLWTAYSWCSGKNSPRRKRVAIRPDYATMTPARAYLIGAILGDGSAWWDKSGSGGNGCGRYGIDCNDKELAEAFVRSLAEVYGVGAKASKTQRETYRYSGSVQAIYEDLASLKRDEDSWLVPAEIMDAPTGCKVAFLRAMYDCEGSASIRAGQATYWSNSRPGLEGIGILLGTLGIESSVGKRGDASARPHAHFLTIPRRCLTAFIEKVSCSIPRKLETLRLAASDSKRNIDVALSQFSCRQCAVDDARGWTDARHYHGCGEQAQRMSFAVEIVAGSTRVGVLMFGPVRDALDPAAIELRRMTLDEAAGQNSESRSLALARKYIRDNRPDLKLIVSFSDPRQGHIGTIYKADGWVIVGRSGHLMKWVRTP